FFFSSRRRHTRSKRDWSSDVCSSDLGKNIKHFFFVLIFFPCIFCLHFYLPPIICSSELFRFYYNLLPIARRGLLLAFLSYIMSKIGRASCRERVYLSVITGVLEMELS